MKKTSEYVLMAKAALGDRHMSDREFGLRIGKFSSSSISDARYGKMSRPVALAVAAVLPEVEPGEILMAALLQGESDPVVSKALNSWAKKVLSPAVQKAIGGVGTLVVALGISLAPAHEALALGGAGGFRRRAANT